MSGSGGSKKPPPVGKLSSVESTSSQGAAKKTFLGEQSATDKASARLEHSKSTMESTSREHTHKAVLKQISATNQAVVKQISATNQAAASVPQPPAQKTSSDNARELPPRYTGIKELHKYHHTSKEGVYCIQYSPNGSSLALSYGDSALEIVNPDTGKIVKELHRHKYGAMVTMCTKFNPTDGNMLMATHGEGAVVAYNIETMTSKEILQEPHNEIYCMDFSCDGLYFATGGRGMDIFVYDVKSNRRLYTLAGYSTNETKEDQGGHARRVFGLRFHPTNSDLLVSGGWDSHLKVWDLRQPDPKTARFISGPVVCGDSLDIKDGKILAGSWRHSEAVQLFDFASGKLIDNYPMITKTPALNTKETGGEYVYCARFCHNGVVLAGGSGTQSVQAIDTNTKEVIAEVELGGNVQAMDCYDYGKQFAFGGMSQIVKVCKMI